MDQAEQLRKLVKQQNQFRNTARVITITSGKGGVGKSNTSVNLAIQISRLGKRVIVLDADFGLANIEVLLGIRPSYNLADLIFRGKTLTDIITDGPEKIGFISGGSGIQELAKLSKEQIIYLTQKLVELDGFADVIIIDTGAGIADSVLEFVSASSEVILLATPEPTSITDAYALMKALHCKEDFSAEHTAIKMVINRVNTEGEGKDIFCKFSTVVKKFLDFKLEYLGEIPQDQYVTKAVMQQKPVSMLYPNSNAAKSMTYLAKTLYGSVSKTEPEKKGIAQLFSNLVRLRMKQKSR